MASKMVRGPVELAEVNHHGDLAAAKARANEAPDGVVLESTPPNGPSPGPNYYSASESYIGMVRVWETIVYRVSKKA